MIMTPKIRKTGSKQIVRPPEEMQQSLKELEQALDGVIEGWSHSISLRGKEMEDHTRRVAEMVKQIGVLFSFSEENLRYLNWGALLHDIGRLAIPDEILLKPGQLSDSEWEVVRRHPLTAYELLAPIPYLRQALEVPYCHHEWWDGTGYPRRLKGDEIPLAARIFTVVDVWDAMTSNRPYRVAWPHKTALNYIEAMSGISFDPEVVKVFITLKKDLKESTD
jgi:HD-GYP domain-containing protein (c-di-GMP phosphodiesterase class II)